MRITRREGLGGLAALGLTAALPAGATTPARTLSNPKASREARAVYRYLWSMYGKRTLAGQQESSWTPRGPRAELDFLMKTTGKLPAILGLDYIDPKDNANVNARAIRWWRDEGGLPSICWHWGAPDKGPGYENSKQPFDVKAALTAGTPQHAAMMRDMAQIGDLLTELRDARVPVLWRPFHEFTGTWFWWGQWGAEGFKALWRTMYRYFVDDRKLTNLIWVLGYADVPDAAYYPGRDMVDIAGADSYVDHHGNLSAMFAGVKAIVGDSVPICLHENGPIPDPAGLGPPADWLWFLTWHTRWLEDGVQNTAATLNAAYNSERYVTKDELPKFV